jgi:adenosylcobinamide-GDP ribazoletransferase
MPFTVPAVPTGMNRGVVTTPWGVWNRPVRARVVGQRAVMSNVWVKGAAMAPQRHWPAWLRDLAGAWVFYSVLPALPWVAPRFERIARFAPWIGLVIGGLQALLWQLSAGWLPAGPQAALVIALGLWLSGGLHSDGAMDTADGLAAGPQRALAAMADSRVGAAGVQALALLLLLRGAGLLALAASPPAAASPALVGWALLAVAVWGRCSPLLAIARFPYLRADGGSAAFHRQGRRRLRRELLPAAVLLAGLLTLALLLAPARLLPAPAAVLVLLLSALPAVLVPERLGRRLGGHSGDTYGACVEWSEALGLLLCGVVLALTAVPAAG